VENRKIPLLGAVINPGWQWLVECGNSVTIQNREEVDQVDW
jgi:hypothetical protein